jgi:hypothetical protein
MLKEFISKALFPPLAPPGRGQYPFLKSRVVPSPEGMKGWVNIFTMIIFLLNLDQKKQKFI